VVKGEVDVATAAEFVVVRQSLTKARIIEFCINNGKNYLAQGKSEA